MVVLTLLYVVGYASWLVALQGGHGPNLQFFNSAGCMTTLGFTIYTYEGIGVVMPIMATTADPSRYKEMVTYAFICLISVNTLFPLFCYYAWGSNLHEAIITQMLPADSIVVILLKIGFSVNLVCSFPIVVHPTNSAIESLLCSSFKQKKKTYYWMQNVSRALVTLLATVIAACLMNKMDKFLGLLGSFLCAPLAITFPALLHLVHAAKTLKERIVDYILIFISICIFLFCTAQSILDWNTVMD